MSTYAGPAQVDVVVIGAGQAGLSASYFLSHRGLADRHVVLDADAAPGGAWQHRSPTLTMAQVHGVHALPGLALDDPPPHALARDHVPAYFADYERRFHLPVRRPVAVREVTEAGDGRLRVATDAGDWVARGLISATGTWTRPFWPTLPGMDRFRGRQLHTADYRGPDELAGRRVVVVGGGHSAMQHLAELAPVADVVWVTRRPPRWTTSFDERARREAVAEVAAAVEAGRRPSSVVGATGLVETPDVRAARAHGALRRRPMFSWLTERGVAWDDGSELEVDAVLWATGFRHAVDHLAPLGLRTAQGGIRMQGTQVAEDPRIHLLGYGPSASTIGANRAARVAVRDLRRRLGLDGARSRDAVEPGRAAG